MCSDKTMKISTDATSSWSLSIYKNDIYEHLKTLEQQRLSYQRRSPQVTFIFNKAFAFEKNHLVQ